ncbi:MAG: TIGR03663 family protein [Chloroflexi bacterium]|nr:TIGR03663 family protein [Chloroflexota bacterium]
MKLRQKIKLLAASGHGETVLWLLLLLIAGGLRFWDLGSRAFHHDESLHATFSWYLFTGRGYIHDPMMHGPFQFFGTALIYKLLGASDYTARILPALMGTILIGLPYFLRSYLGRVGSLGAALLLAISPSFLYFSRFARNDIYIAVWSLLLVIAIWRYIEERQARYLYLAAAALSLSFSTKEVTYITVAIFGSFFLMMTAGEWLVRLNQRLRLSTLSPSGTIVLILGTLSLPLLAAFSGPFLKRIGYEATGLTTSLKALDRGDAAAAGVVVLLFIVSISLGWRWHLRRWLLCGLIFWGIFLIFYTSFFDNPKGLASGIWGSLDYWLAQHGVRRGAQPWYYYLLLIPIYEYLPLLLALVGGIYYAFKGNLFSRFLVYWAGLSFFLYSFAGEKMPWLSLHMALPLILLAGLYLGRILPRLSLLYGNFASRALSGAGLIILLGLAALTVRTAWLASYRYSDVPKELLIYTQTAPDVVQTRDEVDRLARQSGQGKDLPITVDSTDGFSWPWAWYLRDYRAVDYPALTNSSTPPRGFVLLLNANDVGTMRPYLANYGPGERLHFRWWFPEELYRGLTPSKIWRGLPQGQNWSRVWDYFMYRKLPHPLGSVDAVAYFPGEEEALPSQPIRSQMVFGKEGTAPGDLKGPKGLALDKEGNIYVADSLNNRIQKYDAQGHFLAAVGRQGNGPGEFQEPWGVAVDSAGYVYVADTWNHRIQKFDSQLKFLTQWGGFADSQGKATTYEGKFYGPRDIAIDAAGDLYVTDTGNERVQKFTANGAFLASYGGEGKDEGLFSEPVGIAIDAAGNIYVADTWNHRVQKFAGAANFTFLAQFPIPGWQGQEITNKPYLAIDAQGYILATDPENHRLLRLSPEGTLLSAIGRYGTDKASLYLPTGIALDKEGHPYVAEAGNHRIQRLETMQ